MPLWLVAGLAQLMLLGADTWNLVKIRSVGWPCAFGLPLKTRAQPCTVLVPRSAPAVPAPTFAVPQAAIACFIVMLPAIFDLSHLGTPVGLSFPSLSK